ncbi:CAP domain-containing protein [Pseudofrankia asymbiotica]|uniref:Alkaline phosphatase n=1 Tax=Pseudofrankia asymbiotica TaxID=1834516 RepID=A0A1V2I9Z4_9ACTN|nr:CAP domain-containing protein [Pseudofrankia asymbiotica]ONH29750.1 alkaline phosphatase [Pseudofrankia asymbiotica]
MLELVAGANAVLPAGAVRVRLSGPFDLSAIVIGDGGRVGDDEDFVFYNQPAAAGVRLAPAGPGGGVDELTIDPRRLRRGAARVVLVASPADRVTPFGRLPAPAATVHDLAGVTLIRLRPPRLGPETALLIGELYQRGSSGPAGNAGGRAAAGGDGAGGWRIRSIGQGYADGLAGLARDFGVDVEPEPVAPVPTARQPRAPGRPAPAAPPDRRAPRAPATTPAGPPRPVPPRPAPSRSPAPAPPPRPARPPSPPAAGPPPMPPMPPTPSSPGRRAEPGPPWAPVSPGEADRLAEVIMLTNLQREQHGLRPLTPEPRLAIAAAAHSADMARRHFFDHSSPEGRQVSDRVEAAGYQYATVAENIAAGQRTPMEVVAGWMNSPGHRRNILLPEITEIGVGYAVSDDVYGCYWTQVFGAPRTW